MDLGNLDHFLEEMSRLLGNMLQLRLNAGHKGLLEADVLQFITENAVGLLEGLPELLIFVVEIPVHANALKSLTREDEPDVHPSPRIHHMVTRSSEFLGKYKPIFSPIFEQLSTLAVFGVLA